MNLHPTFYLKGPYKLNWPQTWVCLYYVNACKAGGDKEDDDEMQAAFQ